MGRVPTYLKSRRFTAFSRFGTSLPTLGAASDSHKPRFDSSFPRHSGLLPGMLTSMRNYNDPKVAIVRATGLAMAVREPGQGNTWPIRVSL